MVEKNLSIQLKNTPFKDTLFVLFLCFCFLGIGIVIEKNNKESADIIEVPVERYSNEPEFITLINIFKNTHTFQKDVYDCNNYSRDLKYVLEEMGYEVYYQAGYNPNDTNPGHIWLSIAFDPQTGEFINNRKIYPVEYKEGWWMEK
jgi:hypothetical protein